jgi:acetoin utilization deacetylase AcuC-like enzyme
MTGFVSSPRFIEHDTGPNHPERPDRIRAIYRAVTQAGLMTSPDPFPEFKIDLRLEPLGLPPLLELEPVPAALKWIETVHTAGHVERVRRVTELGGVLDQGDTPTERRSFETARLAVGAALVACDAVMTGKVRRAFVAARPPGHHAEPDRAMGFCLFNNVAIAARYLQQKYGLARVAIVDFDVHHGNGTQEAFDADPSVLFISLHQDPRTLYPGSGLAGEIGVGAGKGFTLNIPMDPGDGGDEYLAAIDQKVIPRLTEFAPEAILLSAGFDAHTDDPLARIHVSDDGFEQITRRLTAAADALCGGRVVSLLEGGYSLKALGRSVVRHLVALSV